MRALRLLGRALSFVCILVSIVLGARRARADAMEVLASGDRPVYGVEAPAGERRAVFVYLHGMCGVATHGCDHLRGAPGWLVCPQASTPCQGGGASWSGSSSAKSAIVDRALVAARARWPESALAPVVLVGFSQGAYVAVDLARAQPGRYDGLLLMGAFVRSGAEELRSAGVRKTAMACGAMDMTFGVMRETAQRLAMAGYPARFASLGRVGHTYVAEADGDRVLTTLLTWLTRDPGWDTESGISVTETPGSSTIVPALTRESRLGPRAIRCVDRRNRRKRQEARDGMNCAKAAALCAPTSCAIVSLS
jgi:pimeloyl-ACP methyl ester carboxylesterase